MLPVPIREVLWRKFPHKLYPGAFSVGLMAGGTSAPVPRKTLSVHPEMGRFSFKGATPAGTITASYYFGLLSEIGAGGYDDAILDQYGDTTLSQLEQLPPSAAVSGGQGLDAALAAVTSNATVEIADSLTYAAPGQTALAGLSVPEGCTVVVRAATGQRPVLRWNAAQQASWVITGNAGESGSQTVLALQGMLLQGADLVLQGNFDTVYLRMMTLDPGTAGAGPPWFGAAIDGLALRPSVLWIEGDVTQLVIERSITGPIRTRHAGTIGQMTATDSVVQSIPTHAVGTAGPIGQPPIFDPASLAASLKFQSSALAKKVVAPSSALPEDLEKYKLGTAPSGALLNGILAALAPLSQAQIEAEWPLAFADLALAFSEGIVSLSRCTVMGPTHTHRLQASESILDAVATVEDPQFGCVRFTAYATGGNLHQPYQSVQVVPQAPLFETRAFGRPEYARLRSDADSWIVTAAGGGSPCTSGDTVGSTILGGAQNGSEMGVYCLEGIPLKRRGLALKFEEYAPIGQLPVFIDVD
jgi:hypothetical protein